MVRSVVSREPLKLARVVKSYLVSSITPLIAFAQTLGQYPDFRIHYVSISQTKSNGALSATRTLDMIFGKLIVSRMDSNIEQSFGIYCFGLQNHFCLF